MFTWNADMIRFLRDASEYTPFNDTLASRAAACFPANAHICDAGCGLGYLSLALSGTCARVSAIDVSPEALDVLRENLAGSPICNVTVMEADAFSLPPEMLFDAMVFCFFGGTAEILHCIKTHCRGKAVLFKKNWATHRFDVNETPLERFTFSATCDELASWGVPYESDSFALEMGQPFRSLADAKRFFRLYEREGGTVLSENALRAKLLETGSQTFPYYLPANRPVGMIIVDAGTVPDTIIQPNGGK